MIMIMIMIMIIGWLRKSEGKKRVFKGKEVKEGKRGVLGETSTGMSTKHVSQKRES